YLGSREGFVESEQSDVSRSGRRQRPGHDRLGDRQAAGFVAAAEENDGQQNPSVDFHSDFDNFLHERLKSPWKD
ncbi:unnamed protein product, partial [Nesidiocoris tenuis]